MKNIKWIFLLLSNFFLISSVHAAGVMEASVELRKQFNDLIIEKMMSTLLTNPFMATLAWKFFIYSFAIGFFYTMSKIGSKTFLHEMVRFFIKVWIVLLCVNPVYKGIKNPFSGSQRLHVWMYTQVKTTFDGYGNSFGDGNAELTKNIDQLIQLQDNFLEAKKNCGSTDASCWQAYLTGTFDAAAQAAIKKEADRKAALTGLDAVAQTMQDLKHMFMQMFDPTALLFPLMLSVLGMIQAFMTMFVLLGLGITTAFALTMAGVFTPLALVNSSFEGRVIGLYKNVFAVGLFTFVHKFILWVATVVTGAIYQATTSIFIKQIAASIKSSGTFQSGSSSSLSILLTSNFIAIFVIIFMQIVAVAKIPSISRDIMNLSLTSIVNLGETLIGSAMGLAKLVGLGTLVAGASAGFDAAANVVEGSGGSKSQMKGSGGGTGKSGGGSGGGSSSININNLNNGGSSSDSPSQVAFDQSKKDVLKKGKGNLSLVKENSQDPTLEKKPEGLKGLAKEALTRKNIAQSMRDVKGVAGSVLGKGGNFLWDGLEAGVGRGDGLGTLKSTIKSAPGDISKGMKASADTILKAKDSIKKHFTAPKDASLDAEMGAVSLLNQNKENLDIGKTDETPAEKKEREGKKAKLQLLANKISDEVATPEDMNAFYKMQNLYASADMGKFKNLAGLSEGYQKFSQEKDSVGEKELNEAISESEKNGQLSDPTLSNLTKLIQSGNLDPEKLKTKTDSNGISIDAKLKEKTSVEIKSAIDKASDSLKNGEAIDGNTRRSLAQIANHSASKDVLAGDSARLETLQQLFGDESKLGSSLSDLKDSESEKAAKLIGVPGSMTGYTENVKKHLDLRKTYEVDQQELNADPSLKNAQGLVFKAGDSNYVLNKNDLQKLNNEDKKQVEQILKQYDNFNEIYIKIEKDLLSQNISITNLKEQIKDKLVETYSKHSGVSNIESVISDMIKKREFYLKNYK